MIPNATFTFRVHLPSPPPAHSRNARCGVCSGHIAIDTHISPPTVHMASLLCPHAGLCGAYEAGTVAGG